MNEKQIEKKLKKYIRVSVIVGIAIGAIFSITASYIVADTLINSKDVYYQDNSNLGASNVQTAIDGTCTKFSNQLTSLKTEILNETYPVGSVYTSVNNTSPATLFGGTWEQLKDRFLLGAGTTYTAGATGGEATHVLTNAELPKLSGVAKFRDITWTDNNTLLTASGVFSRSTESWSGTHDAMSLASKSNYYYNNLNFNMGGDQPHNNMPPYLVVYMWKRTK